MDKDFQYLSPFCENGPNMVLTDIFIHGKYTILLPCLQTIRVSDRDFRTVIGRTRHVTRPICSRIDWLTGPKIRIVGLKPDFHMINMIVAIAENGCDDPDDHMETPIFFLVTIVTIRIATEIETSSISTIVAIK